MTRRANEDLSAYGPVGDGDVARHTGAGRRHASRQACRCSISGARARVTAFPRAARCWTVAYNPFLARFLLVPVVLTAPLFGLVLQSRAATASLLVIASVRGRADVGIRPDEAVPLGGRAPLAPDVGRGTPVRVQPGCRGGRRRLRDGWFRARACVGAVLGLDRAVLSPVGPRPSSARSSICPSVAATSDATVRGVSYVVISASDNAPVAIAVPEPRVEREAARRLLAARDRAAPASCRVHLTRARRQRSVRWSLFGGSAPIWSSRSARAWSTWRVVCSTSNRSSSNCSSSRRIP